MVICYTKEELWEQIPFPTGELEKEEKMVIKIAIASTDGKVVNQHFGRADAFHIIDADSETMTFSYRERRSVVPICQGQEHEDDQLLALAQRLKDCSYILVSRIGLGARNVLEQQKIEVFELPGFIEDSLKRLFTYIEIQKMLTP